MKRNDIEIQQIRLLLDKFYDGTCSHDEELALRDFFSAADPDSLPADMLAERKLFSAIGNADRQICDMAPQKMIEDCLTQADTRKKNPDRRHVRLQSGKRRPLMLWLSATAAAMIAIAVILMPKFHRSETIEIHDAFAENFTPTVIDTTKPVETKVVKSDLIDSEPYAIIDNQEEARRLVAETMALIGDRMTLANNTISKSREKINSINTTVKNILKNEKI